MLETGDSGAFVAVIFAAARIDHDGARERARSDRRVVDRDVGAGHVDDDAYASDERVESFELALGGRALLAAGLACRRL